MTDWKRLFALSRGDGLPATLVRGVLGSAGVLVAGRVLALAWGIVLARNLGPEGYGIYAYAFAIMSLVSVGAQAGVPIILMREIAASEGRGEWGVLRGVLRWGWQLVGLFAIVVSAIGLLAVWLWPAQLSDEVAITTLLMLLVLPFSVFCKTATYALRGLRRVVMAQSVDMLVRPALALLFIAFVFVLWPDLRRPHIAMAVQLAVVVISFGVAIYLLRRAVPEKVHTVEARFKNREWIKALLPFTLIGGANIISQQTDVVMLGWYAGSSEVGLYRVAVQGANLALFGLVAVRGVVAPQFSRMYARGAMQQLERLAKRSSQATLLISLPVVIAFIAFGGVIIRSVFGEEYVPAYLPLAILSIGQLVNAGFGAIGFLLNMTGNESAVARIVLKMALANIVLNAALIPFYGMTGAAVATAVTLIAGNMLYYHRVRKSIGINPLAFG